MLIPQAVREETHSQSKAILSIWRKCCFCCDICSTTHPLFLFICAFFAVLAHLERGVILCARCTICTVHNNLFHRPAADDNCMKQSAYNHSSLNSLFIARCLLSLLLTGWLRANAQNLVISGCVSQCLPNTRIHRMILPAMDH